MSRRSRQLILLGAASALAPTMAGICWVVDNGNRFYAGQFRDPHLMSCDQKLRQVSGLADASLGELAGAANAASNEAEKN